MAGKYDIQEFRDVANNAIDLIAGPPDDAEIRGGVVIIAAVSEGVGGERDGQLASTVACATIPAPAADDTINLTPNEYLAMMNKVMEAVGKFGMKMCGREGDETLPEALAKLRCMAGLFASVRKMSDHLGFDNARTFAEVALASASLLADYEKDPKRVAPTVMEVFAAKKQK